jgi:hypothetical protein
VSEDFWKMRIDNIVEVPDTLVKNLENASLQMDVLMRHLRDTVKPPQGLCFAIGADNKLHVYPIGEEP